MHAPQVHALRKDRLTLTRFVIALVCVPLIYGFGRAFGDVLHAAAAQPARFTAFGVGAAIMLLLWAVWLRGRVGFWETFEHELTHALFSVLCFKPVRDFRATPGNGYLVHEGDNLAIRLAPYFFPTPVVVPLILKPVVTAGLVPYVDGIIGAALVIHLIGTVRETHCRQPDLVRTGFILSSLVLAALHLVFVGVILVVAGFGYSDVVPYFTRAFVHIWRVIGG